MLTDRPPRICLAPGCGVVGVFSAGYCPAHSGRGIAGKALRPLEQLYHTSAYKHRFQPRMKSCNPICQRIINGERCTRPSTVLHHLNEPRTNEGFHDPKNIVMLCACHHPGGKPGTPEWREGVDYAPTNWPALCIG